LSRILKKLFFKRESILIIVILIIITIAGIKTDSFLSVQNFKSILFNVSVNSIIAAGMTILFISGGFDLSAGSVLASIGIILGILLVNKVPFFIAIFISLLIGITIGICIGLIITKLEINPFITTLGAMFIFRGMAFLIGEARSMDAVGIGTPSFSGFPEVFNKIASGTFYGIEYIVFYMVVIIIILYIFLLKNKFFRQNYYLGGNEKAARLIGIKIDKLKIFNYGFVGLMVAIAAVLRASRVGTVSASNGEWLGLEVVAAVIVGGASLGGGEGSIFGSFLGVFLISIINNATTLIGLNPYFNNFFVGLILLLSVIINKNNKTISNINVKKRDIKISN